MATMKAAAIYPEILKRFSDFKKSRAAEWSRYASDVKERRQYNDFLTRISWDLLHLCFNSVEICSWYKEHELRDNHITTAVRKAYIEVFGNI